MIRKIAPTSILARFRYPILFQYGDFVAAMTHTGEPQFGLKIRNRVATTENSILTFARNGNTQGIIELFKKRRASPNDISAAMGNPYCM